MRLFIETNERTFCAEIDFNRGDCNGHKNAVRSMFGHLGKIVKVKFTMEEEGAK